MVIWRELQKKIETHTGTKDRCGKKTVIEDDDDDDDIEDILAGNLTEEDRIRYAAIRRQHQGTKRKAAHIESYTSLTPPDYMATSEQSSPPNDIDNGLTVRELEAVRTQRSLTVKQR